MSVRTYGMPIKKTIACANSEPEVAQRPERGHPVVLAGHLNGDYQRGKRRERFHRVDVGTVRAFAPRRQRALLRIDVIRRLKRAIGHDLRDDIRNPQRSRKQSRKCQIFQFRRHLISLPSKWFIYLKHGTCSPDCRLPGSPFSNCAAVGPMSVRPRWPDPLCQHAVHFNRGRPTFSAAGRSRWG